jgi:hypothetical protein
MVSLTACGKPDTRALQQLACQQVAGSIEGQSVSQIDTLRKALGLAPGVDPLGTCRELGVSNDTPAAAEPAKPTSEGKN